MTESIEIRRYPSGGEFEADAPAMAASGWYPISQVETTEMVNPLFIAIAVGLAMLGILFVGALLLAALVVFVLAFVARPHELVVTYRRSPAAE